ncbi:MAG: MATE family efflux transporter [Treponema sp.]|nr:MATE family efflux transporter [Candidatus Treponema scatequi]
MSKNRQIDMTEGPILGKFLIFSLPIIASGILQLLFNAADIIVVGKFAGDESLAAVGSTGSLINLLVNLFVGLSIGTNVVAANFFGAGKKKELELTVHTAILLSFISGIFLTGIGVVFAKEILKLMNCPEEVLRLAALYLKIYFGGITATMVYNFGSAILRAKGDTQRPLYILFLAGIINVILNLIFVIFFRMGVAGVATATVISQTVSAILIIIILLNEDEPFKLNFKKLAIDRWILIKIIKIGVPTGFQGIMFSFSNVIIQSSVNSFGSIIIAGNSAAQNIEGFVYISMNSFAQGTLTFVSQNYGARKFDRIKKVTVTSLLTIFVIGLLLGNLVVFFAKPLASIYSNTPEAINAAVVRLQVICSIYFLCGIMDTMGSSIRGMGHSVLPMVTTMIGACGIRILWLATVFQIKTFHSPFIIYLSYPVSWIITFITQAICFIVIYNRTKKNVV